MNATYPLCMLYIPSDFLRKYIFFHTFVFEENNNDSEKYLDSEIDGEREFSDSSFGLAINMLFNKNEKCKYLAKNANKFLRSL